MGKRKRKRSVRHEPSEPSSTSTHFDSPFAGLSGVSGGDRAQPENSPPVQPSAVTPPGSNLEAAGKLVIQRERKGRAGKTVTRISGLPTERVDDLAKQLKSALGCGAVVEGGHLIVLGDLVDRVAGWLEKQGARQAVISGRAGS